MSTLADPDQPHQQWTEAIDDAERGQPTSPADPNCQECQGRGVYPDHYSGFNLIYCECRYTNNK